MLHLGMRMTQMGVPFAASHLFNESLITRARNYAADEFMRSEATHLLFIDSDIGFEVDAVIQMLILMSVTRENDYDIMAAPYPKKQISWEKIKQAVDMGAADEDPNKLGNFVGDYVFNPLPGVSSISLAEPAEVLETGTGFMMIKRATFEKFAAAYPQYNYRPDHVRDANFDGSREIMQYFQAEIDPESKRYLSEDYWFCQKARAIGLKTWLCPWMQLKHAGSYIFAGSLGDISSIGAAATADPAKLNKGN